MCICICICIWSNQLYIYPQTAKQPCKDVHSRSSSILGQTSPNQLEFQTGLAFNLLPAFGFSVQFFLDLEKIILENIQKSKKNRDQNFRGVSKKKLSDLTGKTVKRDQLGKLKMAGALKEEGLNADR